MQKNAPYKNMPSSDSSNFAPDFQTEDRSGGDKYRRKAARRKATAQA